MNKRWKIKIAIMLSIVFACPISQASSANQVSAQALESKTVYIDDQSIQTTAIMQNGLQLVPASFFRKLNVNVVWNKHSRTANLSHSSVEIAFPVGERYANSRNLLQSSQYQKASLDTRTTLINGVSYVPLAYTVRTLGFSIGYDVKNRAAVISTGTANFVPLAVESKAQPTTEELYWMYQVTEAEAGGESYDGKVAVAASILNRVADPVWPNSIIDTIFQVEYYNGKAYYQYSPVLDKRIHTVTPSEETKRAVQEAINGSDPSLGAVVFYNPKKTDNAWVRSRPVTIEIGNHVFAK